MIGRKAKARLDADRTAKPLTQIVAHVDSTETIRVIGLKIYPKPLFYEIRDLDPTQPYQKLSWWDGWERWGWDRQE
jgi:hypothetical protein